MKLIACLDRSGGMAFAGRRQSQDRLLRERLLALVGGKRLFLNAYSAKQFESQEPLSVSEDFWERAGDDDFCFVENTDVPWETVTECYLFFWNRDYPGDCFFPLDRLKTEFQRVRTEQFAGSSHSKITLEIYRRR